MFLPRQKENFIIDKNEIKPFTTGLEFGSMSPLGRIMHDASSKAVAEISDVVLKYINAVLEFSNDLEVRKEDLSMKTISVE